MSLKKIFNKPNIVCYVLAVIHLIITFFTDARVFDFAAAGNNGQMATVDYTICKLCVFVILFLLYKSLYVLIFTKSSQRDNLLNILKCAAPYMIVALIVMAIKLPAGYISNDENAIYGNAVTLTHDTWFYYITTYYYIISIMIFPFKYGPIIAKVIIQILTVGYVVYRIKSYFGSKLGLIGYILFLLYPVIAYTTSAHRLPIYFLLYLDLFAKLLFDGLEGKKLSPASEFVLIFFGAVLTQWRTEGIYLAVLIPILVLFTYPQMRKIKAFMIFALLTVLIQYVISIPQNGFAAKDLDDAANDRMKPFYAYTITNMYRNGLDLEKNAQDMNIIDKYISIDSIAAINEHYVDINYEDVLILYQEGFVGVREDATVEDFINYSDAVKRIFINNPDVFLKTRWGAFCYAALPFKINFSGFGIKNLISFGISIVKSVSYNLFVPVIICLVLGVYSLIKRKWYSFFVFGGLLAHWFIVFILAPASYFKYYFPIYITAYFYVLVLLLWRIRKGEDTNLTCPIR